MSSNKRELDHHLLKYEQFKRQSAFIPPYCTNPHCRHHHRGTSDFFRHNGWLKSEKMPFLNKRYYCGECGRQFSYSSFQLDFRKKMPGLCREIFICKTNGMSNLSIARKLNISECAVRIRLAHLKRQGFLRKKEIERDLKIKEPVVYDGFETFSFSQFDPCYVNTAIGKTSLYTYELNFSPLNRKGRMTEKQKVKNVELNKTFGRYASSSIQEKTTYTLAKLMNKCPNQMLMVYTDEHKSYLRSIKHDLRRYPIVHSTTNSQEVRNSKNPLFAVNHLHLWYRHFLSSQRRETIAFHKNEAGLMDAIFLQTIAKNFMAPQMYKRTPYNEKRNRQSPAMAVGLVEKILTFEEFYDYRRCATQLELDPEEMKFYRSQYLFQRRKNRQYSGP